MWKYRLYCGIKDYIMAWLNCGIKELFVVYRLYHGKTTLWYKTLYCGIKDFIWYKRLHCGIYYYILWHDRLYCDIKVYCEERLVQDMFSLGNNSRGTLDNNNTILLLILTILTVDNIA